MTTATDGVKKEGKTKIQKFLLKFLAQGGRLEEVALKTGVSYSALVSWKDGRREPGGAAKILIEKLYGVNV